jgi:hypothetical protein
VTRKGLWRAVWRQPSATFLNPFGIEKLQPAGWKLFAIALAVALFSSLPTSSQAGSGSQAYLPLPGKKVTTGLSLTVDTEWVDGNGYRPVKISIRPLAGGAATADRTLNVTLRPKSRYNTDTPSVSTSITLEQGQTVATKIVNIPQYQKWSSIKIVTYEDGGWCDDLSETVSISQRINVGWSEAAPTILIIDSDAAVGSRGAGFGNTIARKGTNLSKQPKLVPDFRTIATLLSLGNNNSSLAVIGINPEEATDDMQLLRMANLLNRFALLNPAELPTDWLQLTSVDIIFISMPDLRVVRRFPQKLAALRTWLSTGTTLCVYDVGEDFNRIPELETILSVSGNGERNEDASVDAFLRREWREPPGSYYGNEVRATRSAQWNNRQFVQPMAVNATPKKQPKASTLKPDDPRPFLLRRVDHGHLVAYSSPNPFPGKREEWCWLFNTLGGQHWMWYQRHGMSAHRENPQYWNLLIPGVGDAPVNSFLVLISLFVVVIGPVNYFMLQRRRKLYLLLLTVPLGAGIITSALFIYAVVNDGLGVRVRARSLTQIDQTNGRTVSWSRQSYYAGLAPSAGMSFPVDAAVYAIDHRPTGRYGQPKGFGRLTRWGNDQRLAGGYLKSRSTSQMMVIESRETKLRIVVDESNADSATPRVTNELGVSIERLLLRSSEGRSLACGELLAGQSVQLHDVDEDEFPARWNQLFAVARPQYPVGFDPDQVENASAIFGNSRVWWQQVDQGLPPPSTTTSVLERGLNAIGTLNLNEMTPRSYIAIVRRAPDVSLGVEGVSEEASFHVVKGMW